MSANGMQELVGALGSVLGEILGNQRTILGHLDTLVVKATAKSVVDRDAGVIRLVMPDGTVRGEEPLSSDVAKMLDEIDAMKAESDRLAARVAADPTFEEARRILRDGAGLDAEVASDGLRDLDEDPAEPLDELVLRREHGADLGVATKNLEVGVAGGVEGMVDGTERGASVHDDANGVDVIHDDVSSSVAGPDAATPGVPVSTVVEHNLASEAASPTSLAGPTSAEDAG